MVSETKIMTRDDKLQEKRLAFEKALKLSTLYKKGLKNFINLCDETGKTALHYAAYMGNLKLV